MSITRFKTALSAGLITTMALTLSSCGGSDNGGASTAAVAATSGAPANCTPKHADIQTLSPGTLTVSVYVSPPYTIANGDTFDGVDGTIIKKLAELECLAVKLEAVAGAGLIASVQSNRADVALGGVYFSEDRAATLSLSEPMYRDGMALLSKDGFGSVEDLAGKKVGVIQGYLWNEELQAKLGTDNVQVYQASDAMIADLKNGRVDAAVLTSAEAGYRAQQDTTLKAAEFASSPDITSSQSQSDVVLAITQGNTSLTTAFNEDLQTLLDDGTIAAALTANGMAADLAGAGA